MTGYTAFFSGRIVKDHSGITLRAIFNTIIDVYFHITLKALRTLLIIITFTALFFTLFADLGCYGFKIFIFFTCWLTFIVFFIKVRSLYSRASRKAGIVPQIESIDTLVTLIR